MNKSKVFDYILQLEDGIQSLLKDNPIKDILVFEIINGALIYAHELDNSNLSDERTARGVVELVIKSLLTKDMLMKAYSKHVNCYNTFGVGNKNKLVHNIDRETKYINSLVDNDAILSKTKKKLYDYVYSFQFLSKKKSFKIKIMKALKIIGQILSSLVYTPLYTGIMYLAIVLPTMWIISLSTWKMIIAFIFLGGIIEGVIAILQVLGLMPFAWIVKNNRISFGISVSLCILFPIFNVVMLWRILLGYGGWGIFAALLLTGLFLQFVYGSVLGIVGIKEETEERVSVSKNSAKPKISTLKRLLLAIPFFRHKKAENTVTSSDGEAISICNKMLSMKIAPMLVEEINTGKMRIDVLSSKEYFRNVLSHLFGKKSQVFINNLRIERRDVDVNPDIYVWLVETPSTGSVGQSVFIGFVYTKQKGVSAYTWEHSTNGSKAVCEWYDKTHYYYGNAENITQFVNEIVALTEEDEQ